VSVRRVDKPWGYELHWAKTDRYVGKVLHINAGHALSLQYHNKKDETIYVHSGKMLFEIGPKGGPLEKREMGPGDSARSHTADEFIYVDEIKEGIRLYIKLLEQLLV